MTEISVQASALIDHPVRGRLNAWLLRLLDGYTHRKLGARKEALFSALPDTVVEIGAGSGANFRYFRPGTHVLAVEPNVHMHPHLRRAAARHGIELEVYETSGERLPLPPESAVAVVCSLVLCSVEDPARVLSEVLRALEPGGRFVCIEHVRAADGTFVEALQRRVLRPWRWFFEGCHTTRDTAAVIEAAGFRTVKIERYEIATLFLPIRPQIAVVATK